MGELPDASQARVWHPVRRRPTAGHQSISLRKEQHRWQLS